MDNFINSAINYSLTCQWDKAIEINKEILQKTPNDLNTLNRLAYAYIQIGEMEKARKTYRKILTIDRYNHIAKKNLDKIISLPKLIKIKKRDNNADVNLSPNQFIEEPGKTKTISLTNLASCSVLSRLNIGDGMILIPKKHTIEVKTEDNIHVGALPDDVSFRLIRFIKAGNTYKVAVKNVTKNCLSVFVREDKKGKKYANQSSFSYPSLTFLSGTNKDSKLSDADNNHAGEKPDHEDEEG